MSRKSCSPGRGCAEICLCLEILGLVFMFFFVSPLRGLDWSGQESVHQAVSPSALEMSVNQMFRRRRVTEGTERESNQESLDKDSIQRSLSLSSPSDTPCTFL
jgi:hypothetical protein